MLTMDGEGDGETGVCGLGYGDGFLDSAIYQDDGERGGTPTDIDFEWPPPCVEEYQNAP